MRTIVGKTVVACVFGIGLAVAPAAFAQQSVTTPPGADTTTFHSVAEMPGPSGTGGGAAAAPADAAMQAFQGMSPEERNAMLQQAIETFKNMSPEQREALTNQAKSMGGDSGSFGSQWDKMLTNDQKQMLHDQLQPYVKSTEQQMADQPQAATAADPVASLTQQIQNLSPEQKAALIKSLQGGASAPTPTAASGTSGQADACAAYQNINPAFYKACESRLHPGQ